MSDVERPHRAAAMDSLRPLGDVAEEVGVCRVSSQRGRVDVLLRPFHLALRDISLAVEVKAIPEGSPPSGSIINPWIKQAADYVGSIPDNCWPQVTASFLWGENLDIDAYPEKKPGFLSALQLAAHFRVGVIFATPRGLLLQLGPHEIYREWREGWNNRAAEWLLAKRVSAGSRKSLMRRL